MKKKISDLLALQVMCINDGDIASSNTLVSVVKNKQGYLVSMGVDDQRGLGLISDRYIPVLYLINPEQFASAAQSSPSFLTPIDPNEQLPEDDSSVLCIVEDTSELFGGKRYEMKGFSGSEFYPLNVEEKVISWFNLPPIR